MKEKHLTVDAKHFKIVDTLLPKYGTKKNVAENAIRLLQKLERGELVERQSIQPSSAVLSSM